MTDEAGNFHKLAKEAGNKLKAYILAFSSAATGTFFIALTQKQDEIYSSCEQGLLLIGLGSFVLCVLFCLIELRIDARRFFYIAKELEKIDKAKQDWSKANKFKTQRLWMIYGSYIILFIGTLSTFLFMLSRILQ